MGSGTGTGALPVGEEGKDFVTLTIVSNPNNSGIWDIYMSHRDYYNSTDRSHVTLCVHGRGAFMNQLEFYVRSIAYCEPRPGALLLIGQIRDLIEERFYEAEVFYSVHGVPIERTGRVRVYLQKEEGLFGPPEEAKPIMTTPVG